MAEVSEARKKEIQEAIKKIDELLNTASILKQLTEHPGWKILVDELKKAIHKYNLSIAKMDSAEAMIRWVKSPRQPHIEQAVYIPLDERDRKVAIFHACKDELYKVIDFPEKIIRRSQRASKKKEELLNSLNKQGKEL